MFHIVLVSLADLSSVGQASNVQTITLYSVFLLPFELQLGANVGNCGVSITSQATV